MFQKLITLSFGYLAESSRWWIKNFLIKIFIKFYKVDLKEAELERIEDYPNFNAFFTRKLKKGVRPLFLGENNLIAPVDGILYQYGALQKGTMVSAKGAKLTVEALLASKDVGDAKEYYCFYLSPRDYHRVHMPLSGKLKKMVYIPGTLFSVVPSLLDRHPEILVKNERAVIYFDTAWGEMVVVMIGALIVGSIQMEWSPSIKGRLETFYYDLQEFTQGAELGHFKMGSTVIILLPKIFKSSLSLGSQVKFGQKINV